MSISPSSHGCDATLQLNVSFAASTVASATSNDSDTVPSNSMMSTTWPASASFRSDAKLHRAGLIRDTLNCRRRAVGVDERSGLEDAVRGVRADGRADGHGVEERLVESAGVGR